MPHKRSSLSLKRRVVRGLIFKYAFHDRFRGEVVSRLDRVDVLSMISLEGLPVGFIPPIERGEVLVDSRGSGSFQRLGREAVRQLEREMVE